MARIDIMQHEKYGSAKCTKRRRRPVSNSDAGFRRGVGTGSKRHVVSCREKFYFSMILCVDYCSNLLSRGVVSETCKRYLKIIDNIPFCCFFCSSLVMVSFTKIESSKACARIIDIVC